MAYTPDWEPLADALRRVTAVGATKDQAKLDLCRAAADGKIRVRVRVAESDHARRGQTFYDGRGTGQHNEGSGYVRVPHRLAPTDFDWEKSCPLAPWPIGPRWGERREPEWVRGTENRPLDLIELLTTAVEKVLCGDATGASELSPATARHETEAINALASQLKNDRQMARASATAWLKSNNHNLGKRAFDRVWSRAREKVGLSPIAAPGRKRKSSR